MIAGPPVGVLELGHVLKVVNLDPPDNRLHQRLEHHLWDVSSTNGFSLADVPVIISFSVQPEFLHSSKVAQSKIVLASDQTKLPDQTFLD